MGIDTQINTDRLALRAIDNLQFTMGNCEMQGGGEKASLLKCSMFNVQSSRLGGLSAMFNFPVSADFQQSSNEVLQRRKARSRDSLALAVDS